MNKATIEKKWHQYMNESQQPRVVPYGQERDAWLAKARLTPPHVTEWLLPINGWAASNKQCIQVWYVLASFFWPAAILLIVLVFAVLNLCGLAAKYYRGVI